MKENLRKCIKCGFSPSKDASITLHRFPKPGRTNSVRCELWAKYCFPNESWLSLEFQGKLHSQHKMLCSKHFNKTCFVEKKLFRTAVPSKKFHVMLECTTEQKSPARETEYLDNSMDSSCVAPPLLEEEEITESADCDISPKDQSNVFKLEKYFHNFNPETKESAKIGNADEALPKHSHSKA